MYRSAAVLAFVVVVACGRVVVQAPLEPAARAEEPVEAVETAQTSDAPPAPPMQRGSDAWCARSLCGCWEDATLRFTTTLRDAGGAPADGVEAFCHGEDAPIARSDAEGVLAFEIATQRSPGCGYQRCRNMVLRDPQGRFAERPVTSGTTGVVTLEPANSP